MRDIEKFTKELTDIYYELFGGTVDLPEDTKKIIKETSQNIGIKLATVINSYLEDFKDEFKINDN